MSNFSNVHDFLSHNQKSHTRIAEYYRQLSAGANGERVKMLLGILLKHESLLASSLSGYVAHASDKVRDTFFQFEREQNIEDLFTTPFVRNQLSCDDVEIIANRFDQHFCDLYADMLQAVDCANVQALFENLRQHMEEEKKRLSMDINSMQDI